MSYRADESAYQKNYKLAAIEFVRLAAERARRRAELRAEQWEMVQAWGSAMEERYAA